jgi:hypothetical protein
VVATWSLALPDDYKLKGPRNFNLWQATVRRSLLTMGLSPADFPHLDRRSQVVILNQLFLNLVNDLQRTYINTMDLLVLWNSLKTNMERPDVEAQRFAITAYRDAKMRQGETGASFTVRYKQLVAKAHTVAGMTPVASDVLHTYVKAVEARYKGFIKEFAVIQYGGETNQAALIKKAVGFLQGYEATRPTEAEDQKNKTSGSGNGKGSNSGSNNNKSKNGGSSKRAAAKANSENNSNKDENAATPKAPKYKECERYHSGKC